MGRMKFNSEGKLLSVDSRLIDYNEDESKGNGDEISKLKTSESLQFLKEKKIEKIFDDSNWGLYENEKKLEPLKFSNGKTQEDVVNEIVKAIKDGAKVLLLHGVCGTGKCLHGDSLVFCKPDEEESFSYHKISDLVGKEGKILSINSRGEINESNFKNVRKTGIKKLYKLKTRTGRDIVLSSNHPLLTITEKGIEWKPVKELNIKSYICLPNKIQINSNTDCDDDTIKILAHLIAEGKLGDKAGSPKYYQSPIQNPRIRKDYINALKNIFPDGIIKERDEEVTIIFRKMDTRFGTTNKLRLLIQRYKLDKKRSREKFIPKEIFSLKNEKIALFLNRLFSCDGSIYYKNNKIGRKMQIAIEYSSTSKRLIKEVSILLQRFGIRHTIASKKFRDDNNYSFRILISAKMDLIRYIKEIGFIGRKSVLARRYLRKLKNNKFTNIDKIPRIIREYLKNRGYSYNELDRFLNYEEIESLRNNIGYKKIIKNKLVRTYHVFRQSKTDFLREHLLKINQHINDKNISFICKEDIIWDKIKLIEYEREDETYDLEVPEHSNFIADGIIVHNSAIALNVARALGRASVVVPIKSLQRQYEEDYLEKKYLLKPNGNAMKIAMITGRENHDSLINPGVSCADPFLPDTIKITEKNYNQILSYYNKNPLINNKSTPAIDQIKRISIAPSNPYWSPILPADFELNHLKDAKKKRYTGLDDRDFIFYHRKHGCSYYDQYLAYLEADIIIFNSAKYKIETAMGRKPRTDIEIFDEADEFLDNLSEQVELNLNYLASSLKSIQVENTATKEVIKKIVELLELEQKNKRVLGVNEDEVYPIDETKISKILNLFKNPELEVEISLDELNYANKALEATKIFESKLRDLYVTYKKKDQDLYATIVTTDLSKKVNEIVDKNKAVLFMSGTLHSKKVLKHVFGIKEFKTIEAESVNQGSIEMHRTGKEFDCKYSNFTSEKFSRKDYLLALSSCIEKSKKPALVQVNAFEDLPTEEELRRFKISNIMARERLISLQNEDKTGKAVSLFKSGVNDILFTTKCSRGIDFPGETCNSVILTKYPNPNINNIFWKILKRTHPAYFWEFYKDKAKREFLQRIYRAVRSVDDHVYVLSPDSRVFEGVRELQNESVIENLDN